MWILDVIGVAVVTDAAMLVEHYEHSSLAIAVRDDVAACAKPNHSSKAWPSSAATQKAGALRRLLLLTWRMQLSYWRDPASSFGRLIATLLFAVISGTTAWGKAE